MNPLCKYSKCPSKNALHHLSKLICIPRYQFCQLQQEAEKSLEFSDRNDHDTDTNIPIHPLVQSLSENPTFVQIQGSDSLRRPDMETIAHRRKVRTPRTVSENERFSEIQNARSVSEIRKHLDKIKLQRKQPTKQKNRIMDILDSIANEEPNASDAPDKEESKNRSTKALFEGTSDIREAYYRAIKVCGYLKEFEEGFKLFEEIKHDRRYRSPRTYSAVMWLHMEQDFSVESLNKCYELLDEMQTQYNMIPSGNVYAELLKNSTGLREHRRASALVKTVMNNEEIYLKSKQCQHAILSHFSKTRQVEKALQFMSTLSQKRGTSALDDVMYSIVISAIASGMNSKRQDPSMIDAAEKLFQQSFSVLGRAPDPPVFSALLNCYGSVPDVASCIDIVRSMISNKDWPDPSAYTYAACLRSLTQHYSNPLPYEEGWKYVDEILDMMGNDWKSQQEFEANYGLLFTLCGGSFVGQGDLEKLYMFYDALVSNGVKLSPSGANSLLLAGVDHYKLEILNDPDNAEEIKKDLLKYIDWALSQYKRNNLSLTKYQNDRLQSKLSDIL
eukprot:169137_1